MINRQKSLFRDKNIMTSLLKQALQAFQDGDFAHAAQLARSFLLQQPDDFYAVHLVASIALVQNMPATAIALIGRLLPKVDQSDDPIILGRLYQTLGRALMEENKLEAARSAFLVAIQYFPEESSAHAGLGEVMLKVGNYAEAITALSQAVRLASGEAVLWGLLGQAYLQSGHYQQAISAYGQAQRLCPEESSFYVNQGSAYFYLAQWEAAHDALEKAFSLGNDALEAKLTMAMVMLSQADIHGAKELFERLLKENPNHPAILLAYGSFCYETGERHEAERLFHRVEVAAKADFSSLVQNLSAQAAYNRSAILLEKGLWKAGWALFEKRKDFMPQFHHMSLPEWDGSAGEKAVSIKLEGGWGDSIMFMRYLHDAAKLRPLRLDFPSEMLDMLKFMPDLPRKRLVAANQPVSAWQSLNSLPFILDEGPKAGSYFNVPAKVEPDLIGICWAGGADYAFDRRRSLPVSLLEPLRSIKKIRFLSLQKEGDASEWMEKASLTDLSDLAKSLQRCALIISVDSLVANMAGTMGKDLWLLHRRGGDWRWSHHFWYQNVRLFYPNQDMKTVKETWAPVISDLEKALLMWVKQGNML